MSSNPQRHATMDWASKVEDEFYEIGDLRGEFCCEASRQIMTIGKRKCKPLY